MSEVNEMKSLTLNGTKYDSFPDQTARAAAAGKLPGPASAAVGQYLVVEEVDADGKITKVKAVEAPTGGSDSGQNVNPAEKTEDMTQPVGVDENGQLWTAPTTSSGSGGGISVTAINLLTDILKVGMFTSNVSGKIESLKEALLAGSSGDSGGSGGGETVADEITFADGMLTIITVGSEVSVADGIMTIL